MEKFKESLPLDQQENRSERTKNSSRSFSPHEGFGRSQENTQQDCSNTLQLEQISNKLSIKERKLQEIKEEKKSADQIFKDVSQLLENIDNIDVVSRNAYIRGQENDKMDKIFKNVKELQKIKQIISNISTKLELYSIKWEYQEEFLKMNEWMNCLNERGKILSGYQGSSDNNTIMLNGEVEFRENLEILKSIKKDLEDNRNKLEQLLEQTLKSKNGSHLINLIEKKLGP